MGKSDLPFKAALIPLCRGARGALIGSLASGRAPEPTGQWIRLGEEEEGDQGSKIDSSEGGVGWGCAWVVWGGVPVCKTGENNHQPQFPCHGGRVCVCLCDENGCALV